jgi:hypothetical protein
MNDIWILWAKEIQISTALDRWALGFDLRVPLQRKVAINRDGDGIAECLLI